MGSALGTVASFVNQGLLLGIPFHIADLALKESKEVYAKWWDQGVGKKRKDGGEDNLEVKDAVIGWVGYPVAKRRRLDPSKAASGVGSTLTMSLTKSYDNVLIEACSIGHEKLISLSNSSVAAVDTSIIKPRRRPFKEKKSLPASLADSNVHLNSDNCYNAFNNIGGMYDFGGAIDSDHDSKDGGNEVDIQRANSNSHRSVKALNVIDHSRSMCSTSNNKTWNNLDGTLKIIGELLEEKNRASEENEIFQMVKSPRDWVKKSIRSELIDALESGKGNVQDKRFLSVLEILSNFYKTSGRDARLSPWCGGYNNVSEYGKHGRAIGGPTISDFFEGCWVNMSRPNYIECLGENGDNDFMYTLGRMSFDMFQPSNLICSVQSTHTTIKIIGEREELPAFVPKSLKDEVASLCDLGCGGTAKRPLLRSYE